MTLLSLIITKIQLQKCLKKNDRSNKKKWNISLEATIRRGEYRKSCKNPMECGRNYCQQRRIYFLFSFLNISISQSIYLITSRWVFDSRPWYSEFSQRTNEIIEQFHRFNQRSMFSQINFKLSKLWIIERKARRSVIFIYCPSFRWTETHSHVSKNN